MTLIPKLLIPTRNRPTALKGMLAYLARFYPATPVIVADGSDPTHTEANRDAVSSVDGRLSVDHRIYPSTLTYYDRMIDLIRTEPDDYFVIGSDDDFPMMDVFEPLAGFLDANPAYGTAMGSTVRLRMTGPEALTAHIHPVRPIEDDGGRERAFAYSAWPFATTYALTRRDVLLERFERAKTQFLCSLYDHMVGLTDSIFGKVKAVADIGFVGTWHYRHSHVRAEGGLIYLRRGDVILTLADQIKRDLMDRARVAEPKAEGYTHRLMAAMIRPQVGAPYDWQPGFYESEIYNHPLVHEQLHLFEKLFERGNPVRDRYEERLRFVGEAMQAIVGSDDNQGERPRYETDTLQMRHATQAVGG